MRAKTTEKGPTFWKTRYFPLRYQNVSLWNNILELHLCDCKTFPFIFEPFFSSVGPPCQKVIYTVWIIHRLFPCTTVHHHISYRSKMSCFSWTWTTFPPASIFTDEMENDFVRGRQTQSEKWTEQSTFTLFLFSASQDVAVLWSLYWKYCVGSLNEKHHITSKTGLFSALSLLGSVFRLPATTVG